MLLAKGGAGLALPVLSVDAGPPSERAVTLDQAQRRHEKSARQALIDGGWHDTLANIMRILCISSSLSPTSRSERLAELCVTCLRDAGADAALVSLKDMRLPGFDDAEIYRNDAYRKLHELTLSADGLVLASPVYNWGVCAELKKYVECVGSTPTDKSRRGAFFDKVVTFVLSAGLPHSYMAVGSSALSMIMDFKCVVNPYTVYLHNRHWEDDHLIPEAHARIQKSMNIAVELTELLAKRTYTSNWEI